MEAWDDALAELQREYLSGCADRLRRMNGCLHLLEDPRTANEALAGLHRELHSLAGSGASYGLPEVSRLGGLGERRCLAIVEHAAGLAPATDPATAADVAELRWTVDALRAEIAAAVPAGEGFPRLSPPLAPPEPARVLSVEDDPEQAAYLRIVLESAGYDFRCSPDPTAFEEDLAAFQPDLVLMDVLLPGATGYELARRVRQDAARAALPILFLTTEGQLSARVESARVGGDDHLTKPVVPELLLAAVASRLERSRALQGMLDRDGLTGLLNQTAFAERARRAVARKAREPRRRAAWVMLDLDHFKSINDRYGHPAGDGVLAALGALLARRLRPADAAGRCGGEEFAILLDDLGERDAVRLADRLREEFHAVEHGAPPAAAFRTSFSAGVAFLRPGMSLDEWRAQADRALYRAKARGRNQVELAVTQLPQLPEVDAAPESDWAVA